MSQLVTKKNISVSSYYSDEDTQSIAINLNERKLKFAFSVENYGLLRTQKNDPRYVKYIVIIWGKRNGELFSRVLPYRNCTEQDYD